MDGTRGLRAWRWLFLIEGVVTVAVAMAAFFILPNFPRTTKWLSEEEVALATWRLEEDIGQDDWINSEEQSLWRGFALALKDAKMWVLVSKPLCNILLPIPCCFKTYLPFDLLSDLLACHSLWQRLSRLGHDFLPYGGGDSQLRQGRDTAAHNTALRAWNHHHVYKLLACGQDGRAVLPRHYSTVCRHDHFHHRRRNDQCGCSICSHDVHGMLIERERDVDMRLTSF